MQRVAQGYFTLDGRRLVDLPLSVRSKATLTPKEITEAEAAFLSRPNEKLLSFKKAALVALCTVRFKMAGRDASNLEDYNKKELAGLLVDWVRSCLLFDTDI